MKIELFVSLLKECKKSLKNTGSYPLLVKTWDNRKTWFISSKEEIKCKTCGDRHYSKQDGVYLHLKEPKAYLTIFEAHLMYMMFMQKQKPYDYGSWHECQSGKEFIENIESIYFNEVTHG